MKLLQKKKKLSKRKKEKLREKRKEDKLLKSLNNETKEKRFDLMPFFGGLFVGIANIIPGVSGGTMLVIFNLFDRLMYAISDIFKRNTTTRKESLILILKVLIGTGIGIIGFAKILGYTLQHIESETVFWFMGLILFSVPVVIKQEMEDEKFNFIFFLIGFMIIALLQYYNMKDIMNDDGYTFNLMHILSLIFLGFIGGASMIFPGVSGSMVLLVLGKYEMIRSLVDKVTTLDVNILLQLAIFGVGVVFGIIISAKLLSSLLNKHKGKTVSLILGFIVASALILPLNINETIRFTSEKVCGLIVSFILGGIVIYYIDKLEKRNS